MCVCVCVCVFIELSRESKHACLEKDCRRERLTAWSFCLEEVSVRMAAVSRMFRRAGGSTGTHIRVSNMPLMAVFMSEVFPVPGSPTTAILTVLILFGTILPLQIRWCQILSLEI